ncbi:hypothetical protein HPP92_003577 [Vanilla planifolia]|uniref:Uncharacterized protein n=1 Tax=Vanilla planifolia TaxID=51239 RepID=A0A835VJG4_VANPL|nr:hypothetical protein HPP92_003961 [Vanilla planifolia]KAG0503505.1 hypothetical protein HPP92_003577 [Vanilla planifolia]
MMQIVTRSGRGLKPLILKLGLALTLSVGGYVVAHLRFRRRLPPAPCPSTSKQEGDKATSRVGLKEELWILGSDEGLATIINGTSTTTITTTKTVVNLSPRSTGDDEGFLLPEFNELVLKEFELSSKDPETTTTPKSHRSCTRDDISSMEQEISQLRDLVLSLRERERSLELQLLEYYGLQEREAAVKELESQLKLSTMEAKLFNVKIESLQAENQRLQNQVLDHSRVSNELEAAKAKLKAQRRGSS